MSGNRRGYQGCSPMDQLQIQGGKRSISSKENQTWSSIFPPMLDSCFTQAQICYLSAKLSSWILRFNPKIIQGS